MDLFTTANRRSLEITPANTKSFQGSGVSKAVSG
jgi:hypothetical protein